MSARIIVGSLACIAACGTVPWALGIRVNTTPSVPMGIYRVTERPPADAKRGDYVFVCPPDTPTTRLAYERHYIGAGFCPGGYEHLIKIILAAKTDVVAISDDGITVNGQPVPATTPLRADSTGRPMPRYRREAAALPPEAVLIGSASNSRSFDARYFGPVTATHINAILRPVWTW